MCTDVHTNVFYKKDTMHEGAFNVMSKARCEVKIYPGPTESLNTGRKTPPPGGGGGGGGGNLYAK